MTILNKTRESWVNEYPILRNLIDYKEIFWMNPLYNVSSKALKNIAFSISDMVDAEARLRRFAPFIMAAFPETESTEGIIESPLVMLDDYKTGYNVMLKCDHALPISGSVKARGGIYEILRYTEELLIKNNIISLDDDYSNIMNDAIQRFLSNYKIVVSSTGNLGLSIGIISAKLGYKVHVHMSHDAMQWKKDLLKSIGATVIEHESDYSKAVELGRASAEKDDNSYFVDDENSVNLFLGYAVSAFRLKKQLEEMKMNIDPAHPLFVYIPCGVGGGPGGITYGLKQVFGDLVHCYFVEPTHAPCMLLGMATGTHDAVSVQDFGIDNVTVADGLAVGRASKFVGKTMAELLGGISTVDDEKLFAYMNVLYTHYDIFLEPSALAGFKGLDDLIDLNTPVMGAINLTPEMVKNGTHIVWATGGDMVPEDVKVKYFKK